MKKTSLHFLYYLQIISLLFILNSCKKDKNEGGGKTFNLTPLYSETIDNSGGTIELEDIKIDIPENAFSEAAVVSLSINNGDLYLKENALSELFHLEGIPYNFNVPIQVEIKCDYSDINEIRASLLCQVRLLGGGDSLLFPFIPMEVSSTSDGVMFEIYPVSSENESESGTKSIADIDVENMILAFILEAGWEKATSSKGNFYMEYQKYINNETDISFVLESLEEAYEFYDDLGFNHDYYFTPDIPLRITTTDFSDQDTYISYIVDEEYGENSWTFPGIFSYFNFGGLCYAIYDINSINSSKFSSQIEASAYRIMGGLEGMFYSLHYKKGGWFAHAIGAWSENKSLTDKPSIIEKNEAGVVKKILKGINYSPGITGEFAPMIKYLNDVSNADPFSVPAGDRHILVDIMDEMSDNEPDWTCGLKNISDVLEIEQYIWYPDYIEKFISNDLYEIDQDLIVNSVIYEFKNLNVGDNIGFETLQPQSLLDDWNSFETRLFRIETASLDDNARSIELNYTGGFSYDQTVYSIVFTINNSTGQLTYLSRGQDVNIKKVNQLKTENKDLIIAVVNTSNSDFNPEKMSLEVHGSDEYTNGTISISVDMTGSFTDGGETCDNKEWNHLDRTFTAENISVSFEITEINGSTIIAEWDDVLIYTGTKGEVEIYFSDESLQTITGFDVKSYEVHYEKSSNQEVENESYNKKFSLATASLNLNKENYDEISDIYEGSGCNNMTIRYYNINNNFAFGCHHQQMDSWTCIDDENFTIYLNK